MKMWTRTLLSPLILFVICSFTEARAEIINATGYLLYLPSSLSQGSKVPLVVAFSPSGNVNEMITVWKKVSEEYKWIILSSKKFRNNIDARPVFSELAGTIRNLSEKYPIDSSKIMATGWSGGGMAAHMFSFLYPDVISAVVTNVGFIHRGYMNPKDDYPKSKLVVFLASSTDPNFEVMKGDKLFLESIRWKAKWIEFPGGHRIAPPAAYDEAARWLREQL
jgi:predicted peptidase